MANLTTILDLTREILVKRELLFNKVSTFLDDLTDDLLPIRNLRSFLGINLGEHEDSGVWMGKDRLYVRVSDKDRDWESSKKIPYWELKIKNITSANVRSIDDLTLTELGALIDDWDSISSQLWQDVMDKLTQQLRGTPTSITINIKELS